jgi:sulfotransferase family protein
MILAPLSAVAYPLQCLRNYLDRKATQPAVLHITHKKAGSQWIYRIFKDSCKDLYVPPQGEFSHLLQTPIQPGRVYPTVYATRQQLHEISFPCPVRRFIVIRDLRDVMVSMYFSLKISHPLGFGVDLHREVLNTMELDEGMLYTLKKSAFNADIIRSWVPGKDPIIRYEDMLENDEAILTQVLIEHCGLPIERAKLVEAIRANRFEKLAGGRQRGQEDVTAHERKGIVGDWRNYFSKRIKDEFKRLYGDVLISSGYERDNNW